MQSHALQLLIVLVVAGLVIGWLASFIAASGWIAGLTAFLADVATIAGAAAGASWSGRLMYGPNWDVGLADPEKRLRLALSDIAETSLTIAGSATVIVVAVWLPSAYDRHFAEHPIVWLLAAPLAAGVLGLTVEGALGLTLLGFSRTARGAAASAGSGTARIYDMHPALVGLSWVCLLVLAAFALIGATLPWRTDDYRTDTLMIGIGGGLFFAGFLALGVLAARRFPYCPIAADDDGLWPAHLDRAQALVPWRSIARVRERPLMQRLDLFSRSGELLLKVEYQLSGFGELRGRILSGMARTELPPLPVRGDLGRAYHWVSLGSIGFFVALGVLAGSESPWIGYLGMGLVCAWLGRNYLCSPCAIVVETGGLELRYPLHARRFDLADIVSVEVKDDWDHAVRRPEVAVFLAGGGKPLVLGDLGIEPTTLYALLEREVARRRASR